MYTAQPTPEEIQARVLHRDGLMLVIDKPAGIPVHRGPKGGANLEASFDALRFGHLSHHALNANPSDRPELFDPELMTRPRAALVFYPRLLFGIYTAEILSGLVSLLPRRWFRPIVRAVFYEGQPDADRDHRGGQGDRDRPPPAQRREQVHRHGGAFSKRDRLDALDIRYDGFRHDHAASAKLDGSCPKT